MVLGNVHLLHDEMNTRLLSLNKLICGLRGKARVCE